MISLQNFDVAANSYDYEAKVEFNATSSVLISGWYKFVDELLSGVMVIDYKLYFLYGTDKFLITDKHRVELKRISEFESEFALIESNRIWANFTYDLPESYIYPQPFDYIDEDDFLWGEFLQKIINNEERKKNFILNLMEEGERK